MTSVLLRRGKVVPGTDSRFIVPQQTNTLTENRIRFVVTRGRAWEEGELDKVVKRHKLLVIK